MAWELAYHWNFSEGSGTTLADIVNSNDGTINGSPTWLSGLSVGTGNGLRFTGASGQYVSMEETEETDPQPGSWYRRLYHFVYKIIYRATETNGKALFVIESAQEYIANTSVYIGTDGKLRVHIGGAANTNFVSSGTVTDGAWHEVMLFGCDGEGGYFHCQVWSDGISLGTAEGNSTIPNNSPGTIKIGAGFLNSLFLPEIGSGDTITTSCKADIADVKKWYWNGDFVLFGYDCSSYSGDFTEFPEYPFNVMVNAIMFSCNT